MKVSEITTQLVAEYLKQDYTTMTAAEKLELDAIIAAAKAYLKSYTGHVDVTVTGETLTQDVESTVIFTTRYSPLVSGTLKVYLDGTQITTGFDVDYSTGTIVFDETPAETPTADYTAGIDAFDDFVIAVYVLCQDMYDNRTMYVDNANVNKVVDNILGMHSINLL
jgi:hypothetical protein